MSVKAKIVGRNPLSARPLRVRVLEGRRVAERIDIMKENASIDRYGPFSLEQIVEIDFDGLEAKVVGIEPIPAAVR